MKNLKFIIAALAFTGLSHSLQAQDRPKLTDEQKQEMRAQIEKDHARMELTPEQETSFKAINQKYAVEMKGLRQTEDRRDKREKGKDLRARKNEEIKAILSEKQYQTYVDIQNERKTRMKERRGK